MEEQDIFKAWKNQPQGKDSSLNQAISKDLTITKIRTELTQLRLRRILEATAFGICTLLLLVFIQANTTALPLWISGSILLAFCLVGVFGSISQLAVISQLDYSTPIVAYQRKLHQIKSLNIRTLQLILLSIPFHLAYTSVFFKVIFQVDIISNSNSNWFWANILLGVLLLPFALWLVREMKKSSPVKWVQTMIMDNGGRPIQAAITFIEDIEVFEGEEA